MSLPALSNRSLSASFSRALPKYFTREEANAIIYTHARNRLSHKSKRLRYNQRFLCWFLWNTGTRITEARNTTIADIEPWAGVIHIRTIKRRDHVRTIPKDPKFFREIQAYILINEIRRKDSELFQVSDRTARRWVTDTCYRGGIPKSDRRAHPHTFRHSFAINCLLHGTPLPVIQGWLGHADIAKTMIYLKVTQKDSRVHMDNIEF